MTLNDENQNWRLHRTFPLFWFLVFSISLHVRVNPPMVWYLVGGRAYSSGGGPVSCPHSLTIRAITWPKLGQSSPVSVFVSRPQDLKTETAIMSFLHGSDGKESTCNVWDLGLIPGLGRSPGEEGMATHTSILAWRIPVDRGAWQAIVHGFTKSRIWLSD